MQKLLSGHVIAIEMKWHNTVIQSAPLYFYPYLSQAPYILSDIVMSYADTDFATCPFESYFYSSNHFITTKPKKIGNSNRFFDIKQYKSDTELQHLYLQQQQQQSLATHRSSRTTNPEEPPCYLLASPNLGKSSIPV